MRAHECRSRCSQPTPFPLHVIRSNVQALEREGEPSSPLSLRVQVISGACKATTMAEKGPLRCGSKVFEKCVAFQNGSITGFNVGKRGVGCKGVFLKVRDKKNKKKHLRLREKVKVRIWGVDGSRFWGKGDLACLKKKNKKKQFFLPQRVGMTKRVRHQPQTDLFSVMIQKRVSQPYYALWWGIQKEY